ncbi:conserved hypothetical protein [Perkinsus marinus ATCC 50983]|uniref:Hint domain-containing protein n=1 Tax=Perkinsus marinus (strain ATCC 50983 / TXsc) TaxID=423536 RepID=C5KL63_PERM5|nr:conserved hypothetical protein [Perkinsus marinus ATCC 50983]EER14736.1 conserved hypothetical protein [Perkinsus marinus ATCC 50983]|eukprot:XP_002782940.1 conserved hypothetical protein [Perkinsus marinus ATCC 50983]
MTVPVSFPDEYGAPHSASAFGSHGTGTHHDRHIPVGEDLHKKEAFFGAMQKMKTKSHQMKQAHDKKYGFPACFAGDNTVTEKNKGLIKISQLDIGDEVLSVVDNSLVYSEIISWLHREPEFEWQSDTCVEIEALDSSEEECRTLRLSGDHLVFLRDKGGTAAKNIRSGDVVRKTFGNPVLPTTHWVQVTLIRSLPDLDSDTVMLQNAATEGFLSANAEDLIHGRKGGAYAVTTGCNATPCIRNVFAVEVVNSEDPDAPVCYGEEVRLVLSGFVPDRDCYLYSEMVSALAASKSSRKQEVGALDEPAGNTRWQFLHPDGKMRFETDGVPIKSDQPVVIKHASSGSFLASDKIKQMNVFGAENEVHAHCYYSTNKTHNMISEKKGEITGDYALRRHGPQNVWQFVVPPDQQHERPSC